MLFFCFFFAKSFFIPTIYLSLHITKIQKQIIMKTLSQTLQSIIKSFNENLSINFVDLRDLDMNLTDRDLFQSFVDGHNNHKKVDFFDLQKLQELINN